MSIGCRVRLTEARLRARYLPEGSNIMYVSVTANGSHVGHAFACRWQYQGRQVCWVTLLVVHRDYSERGLARSLMRFLRDPADAIIGIMSSHPYACAAAAKAFGSMVSGQRCRKLCADTEPRVILRRSPLASCGSTRRRS